MNHGPLIPPKLFNFSLIKLNGRDFAREKCVQEKIPPTRGESFWGLRSRKMGARLAVCNNILYLRISLPTNQLLNPNLERMKNQMENLTLNWHDQKGWNIMIFMIQREPPKRYLSKGFLSSSLGYFWGRQSIIFWQYIIDASGCLGGYWVPPLRDCSFPLHWIGNAGLIMHNFALYTVQLTSIQCTTQNTM